MIEHEDRYSRTVSAAEEYAIGIKPDTETSRWYDLYLPMIRRFITCDVFTDSLINQTKADISSLACVIPSDLKEVASSIFASKNKERKGSWPDVGAVGAMIEIHAKLSRLRVSPGDHDSLVDLFNYCIIFLMCCDMVLLRPGDNTDQESTRKTAIVTGANQGLGEMVSKLLYRDGYFVLDIDRPSIYKSEIQHNITKALGGRNKIDVLINNFGINHLSWIGEIGQGDRSILDYNLWVPIAMVDAIVSMGLGPCKIINVASQTYRVAQRCTALYCASKAGMVHATKVMARELAPKGYVVNAIAPGMIVDTKMSIMTNEQVKELRGWSDEQMAEYALNYIPMGRHTDREEVATAILKMINLPDYINGAVIDMTGGQ